MVISQGGGITRAHCTYWLILISPSCKEGGHRVQIKKKNLYTGICLLHDQYITECINL
jgi:hypothetical protein